LAGRSFPPPKSDGRITRLGPKAGVACNADFLDGAKDVLRYLKNERFGFSVTYYEHNRPRQFYPDFIIAVRESDGSESMWLAETKGEMRTNVPLKNGAAQIWCEKMSTTKYGKWRYLFAQQLKLEKPLGKGITTFVELVANLFD